MRVVQLIDSLEAGGAERMAVNIANGLCNQLSFSSLVTTRKEGALKKNIQNNVFYSFLGKKSTFDIKSILKFRAFIRTNNIDIIHAHGSSYFYAILVKITFPKVKIFWHDHHGNRLHSQKANSVLKLVSFLFSGVFTVNEELKDWAKKKLFCKNIHFIPNFAVENPTEIPTTFLKGELGKRMICLANLRNPKNHITLLKSFVASDAKELKWTLHLVGYDKEDSYSNKLKQFVEENNLKENVFFYGSCNDIGLILKQGSVGVLTSTYEGFPVTILEYGKASLAVISTNVGYCNAVIRHNITGLLFDPLDETELTNCINVLLGDSIYAEKLSNNLHKFVDDNYSELFVVNKLIKHYNKAIEK
jgi:glycosyltransferase involved in cell wall biosynthesis